MTKLFKPEDYNLGDWENRVTESLFSAIHLHVEDTKRLPSADEYVEMARYAIESPTLNVERRITAFTLRGQS